MFRRLLAAVAFFPAFMLGAVNEAAGQPLLADHRLMVSEHTMIREIGAFLNRTFHPVEVLAVDVPMTLAVGEEGLFSIQINVERATLPILTDWEFGDGATAAGLSVRHTFSQPGRYTVQVRVANRGSEASRTLEIEVQPNELEDPT